MKYVFVITVILSIFNMAANFFYLGLALDLTWALLILYGALLLAPDVKE